MKKEKYYVIMDMVSLSEDGLPFYWYGHYSNKKWTTKISEAVFFNEMDEVTYRLHDNEFDNGIFEIKTIYK